MSCSRRYNAEKIDGEWVQRLRIHYNCVGEMNIPNEPALPIPAVTVNTRKGVFVSYTTDPPFEQKKRVSSQLFKCCKNTRHGPSDRIRTCGILLPNLSGILFSLVYSGF